MRKFYLLLTLICTLLTSVPVKAQGFDVDGIYYYIMGPSSVEVTYKVIEYGEEHDYYSGEVIIPESVTYEGKAYTVKAIGMHAFSDCPWVTTVRMPETIETIGANAFRGCLGLTEIEIPDSVIYIDSYAFKDCISLTNIKLPPFLQVLDLDTFLSCYSLESVVLPESLTKISSRTFMNCTSLKSIIIPDKVETIDVGAFFIL